MSGLVQQTLVGRENGTETNNVCKGGYTGSFKGTSLFTKYANLTRHPEKVHLTSTVCKKWTSQMMPCFELRQTFGVDNTQAYTNIVRVNPLTQVQAELHKDPHVKPEQVSISRSSGCLSLHSRPSAHDPPFHVHGPGTVSPVAAPALPAGKPRLFTLLTKPEAYFSNSLHVL